MADDRTTITIDPSGAKDFIKISGNRSNTGNRRQYNGPPAPNPGTSRTRRGPVRNQFNITGSTIGAIAVGNTGTTILNQKNQRFQEGSKNVEFDIKGGNFNQANLGESAVYKNEKSSIVSRGGNSGNAEGLRKGSIEQDLDSDMVAEKQLVEILKKNVPVSDIKKLLVKGLTISQIWNAVKTQRNDAAVSRMIHSMLLHS